MKMRAGRNVCMRVSAMLLAMAPAVQAQTGAWDLGDAYPGIAPRSAAQAARVAERTALTNDFSTPEPSEFAPAGAATVPLRPDQNAFSQPSANIGADLMLDFVVGNGLFRKEWVAAPSAQAASDGLGPLYNARSCEACHIKDGRGHPPEGPQDDAVSMFLRIAVPAVQSAAADQIKDYIATAPDPTYGHQLQDFGVQGQPPEARLDVRYSEREITLADGTIVSLRHPTYAATDLAYGPLHPQAVTSPRIAPQMIGLGLLEAVAAADIIALSDPDDRDADGISGRINVVWSVVQGKPALGRFGLKAGSPSILEQTASAFAADIGISSPLARAAAGDCTAAQLGCLAGPHGDNDVRGFEIDAVGLDLVATYSRHLGVPVRRGAADPQVLRGKQVFYQTGCTACHTPAFVTGTVPGQPALSGQQIWPFTDMLLHDMGPDLADGMPEARATGREWRTPPLWGIGLTQQVGGHSYFLHDGRARSVLEAVLWHGGEAAGQRDAVVALSTADRDALLAYLNSL